MTTEDARKSLEKLKIEESDESFFKYLKAGDREVVELFLALGTPPDLCDGERNAAVVVAANAGQKDLARLLLARGASAEPLLNRASPKKDRWDKISASGAILSFISSVLIAVVGGYFTYSYNQRQIALNKTQADHDTLAKDQANRVLELDAVQKLIPVLTSKDEQAKTAALIALQDLAHPELATHLAVMFKSSGGVQYLLRAALSADPATRQFAVEALVMIADEGTPSDFQLVSRALAIAFESVTHSVVQVFAEDKDVISTGSGIVVTADGYILTSAHVVADRTSPALYVVTSDRNKLAAEKLAQDYQLDVAIWKVRNAKLVPVRMAPTVSGLGSRVIGIGYVSKMSQAASFVGTITAIGQNDLYFSSATPVDAAGGCVLNSMGETVGFMNTRQTPGIAVRSDIAVDYLRSHGVEVLRSKP